MPRTIPEADWRHLRHLRHLRETLLRRALDAAYHAVREEATLADSGDPWPGWCGFTASVRRRAGDLDAVFADWRRSNAFLAIATLRSAGYLMPEEFAGFSSETQAGVRLLNGEADAFPA